MLLLTLSALLCASGCVQGAVLASDKTFYAEETHAQHFEEFKITHNKQYSTPEEEQHRFEIFKNNLNRINELNVKYENTVFGINKFTDLTPEEVVATYTGLVLDENRRPSLPPLTNFSSIEVPESFDWRDKKVVTRVKDQGSCGSCWAFATIGSLESNYAIKNGKLQEFSEQQLVDCEHLGSPDPDNGCGGGDPELACKYIHINGEMSEADYPYTARDGTCQYDSSKTLTKAKLCKNYAGTSEDDLKKILYTKGPLVLGIDSTNFFYYGKGILQQCSFHKIGHAVLLVGYGTENGVPFWIIKNSWGKSFGEDGYVRIKRGVNCLGLVTELVLPVEV